MLRHFKLFMHVVLMLAIPSTALYPQSNAPAITIYAHETAQELLQNDRLLSYDEILNLLDDLENGTLEEKCTEADLDKINHFLANLAKQGLLPNVIEEGFALESDIQELLYGCNNPYEYALALDNEDNYTISPSLLNNQGEIILCKNWIAQKWKQTKKFVKKHKKAMIIGAAVVITATVVICVVAAASTEGAIAATAGAATSSSKKSEKDKSKTIDEQIAQAQIPSIPSLPPTELPHILTAIKETPMIREIFEDHMHAFKETITENQLLHAPSNTKNQEASSFGDSLRHLGSDLAHQALDAVDQLTCYVPQLLDEIKDLGQYLPEGILSPSPQHEILNGSGSPKENHENLIAQGHETIDRLFSTDQAPRYSPEGKEATANSPRGQWTIASLPLPGLLPGTNFSMKELKQAGRLLDKGGYTRAGRASVKHGYREGSVFPKPTGNSEQINQHGQKILEDILENPNARIHKLPDGSLKIYSPDGRGAFFRKDGSFRGFIEEQYE